MASKYFEGESFRGLSLSGARLENLTLVDCAFQDCTFESCQLSRCELIECRFVNCRVSDPKCEYSQVKFLSLEDCALSGVNWGLLLPSSGFGDPIDRLSRCRMKYSFFTDMDLRRFDFSDGSLTGCMFAQCNLAQGLFGGCELTDTEFVRCDLTGADFREARGYKVDVPSCTLKNAAFTLPEAANLLYSLGIRLE